MSNNNAGSGLECTIPVLPVSDLAKSVAFYTNVMGFTLDWGDVDRGIICSVSRDRCALMLRKRSEPTPPGWVWIGVENESVLEEFRTNGARVVQEPMNFSWAYEMKFQDVDGNILWVGTEPRRDERFEGSQ